MKKILITGATSGISYKLIERIKKNYYIYVCVHTDSQLKNITKKYSYESNIKCLKLDVKSVIDRKKIDDLDIDILISMAAIGYGGSISEISIDKVRDNFEVNVFSNFEIIQSVIKKMNEKKSGKIIVIGSLASMIPLNFLGVYSATKASIKSLTVTLHNEFKLLNNNIKIVLIEPGMYHTGFNQVMLENKYDFMEKDSYFKEELEIIRNNEKTIFGVLEKNNLNSVVKKIEKAINLSNPKKIYRAPILQYIGAKLYYLFKL